MKKVSKPKAIRPAMPPSGGGGEIIDRLWATVVERRSADPTKSHSARLLSRGYEAGFQQAVLARFDATPSPSPSPRAEIREPRLALVG